MGAVGQRPRQVSAVEHDRLLHVVLDHLPALISYWDHDVRCVLANETFLEWFGLDPDQMPGIHLRDVLGEEVYRLDEPVIAEVLRGEQQAFDRALTDGQGHVRVAHVAYVPDIVDGEVRGFFVLATDVTARVEAQRAMDEAQSLARVGSWEMALATGEIWWSDELYRIFGYEPGTMTPTLDALLARVDPADVPRVVTARERAVREKAEYHVEYVIRLPDGSVREIQSRGRPILDVHGDVVRLAGALQDVTELNQAARQLMRTNDELLQLNELNSDVLGMLGHDVRGPLTVVLGYLEELEEDWAATAEEIRRAHVTAARAAAGRLRTLVDDILALASVETGTIVAEPSDHDLTVLVVEALSEVPGHGDISLEGDRYLKVWCDAFQVRQIIANLASNALRYGAPPVVVSLGPGDDTAQVVVSDQGPGVPEELVDDLFDRFARGPGQNAWRGSGLGLYIARRLAEANEATLTYERGTHGQGATFRLTLPRFG